VAATLAVFVRHGLFFKVKSNRIMPSHTLDAGFLNYSTTPHKWLRTARQLRALARLSDLSVARTPTQYLRQVC
jgi:hypothetical protein